MSEKFELALTHFSNRDPKDNFLSDLTNVSMADYLVTGDKDLLVHNPFKTITISMPVDFENLVNR